MREANGRMLVGPLLLSAAGLLCYAFAQPIAAWLRLAPGSGAAAVLEQLTGIAGWLALAWSCARLLDLLLHRAAIVSRRSAPYPRLLADLLRVLLFAGAVVAVLLWVFHRPATGLIATSSVVIAVAGFALRNIIADLFSGIALGIEHPYRIGDWIETAGGSIGRVMEINWRATRLQARNGSVVVVPNGLIAGSRLVNYSNTQTPHRAALRVPLDAALPTERMVRILQVAALAAERAHPRLAPDVVLQEYEAGAAIYVVRFHMTDYEQEIARRDAVARSVLQALHRLGLGLARPGQDVRLSRADPVQAGRRREALLRHIDLFRAFDAEECAQLVGHLRERAFATHDVIVRAGDAGDSLYVLAEGMLDVHGGPSAEVAAARLDRLLPGDVFGEMSLLTGQPRSATVVAATDCVVYEIRKQHLDPLLERRPELAEHLATIMADRQLRNAERRRLLDAPPEAAPATREDLLRRVRAFFNLF